MANGMVVPLAAGGDGRLDADLILEGLAERGPLTTHEISDLFARHRSAEDLHGALDYLVDLGAIEATREPTRGRPVPRWTRRAPGAGEESEKSEERAGADS